MTERFVNNTLTWIDLLNPSSEEIRAVLEETNMPREYAGDLGAMVQQSILLSEKGALKVKLNIPVVRRTDITHPHEIKCIATKKFLVTVHYEDIEALHRFKKKFEVLSILKKAGKNASGAHLLVALIDSLYDGMDSKLDHLESRIDSVEKDIFNEKEKEMVFEMSKINRRLISFRQTISAQQDTITCLPLHLESAFSKAAAKEGRVLQEHYDHLMRRAQSLRSTLEDLHNTNTALLYTKQNEVMKILTILAFITFPLTLFTSMFGMNTMETPLVGQPGDFWIILLIMVIASVGFFAFFKFKKWM